MQPGPQPREDRRLSALLQSWTVDAEPPPRFATAVWRRIRRNARPSPGSILRLIEAWLIHCLRRRRFVAAYLAILILAGAGAGAMRGQAHSQALAASLESRYVQSVDPFALAMR